MTHRECSFAVLLALFDLTRAGLPSDRERVAARLDLTPTVVRDALDRLTCAGLVRGERLTLAGLALASSLDATCATLHVRLAA